MVLRAITASCIVALWFIAHASAAGAGKRVALVIGNAAYAVGPLRNPGNDAAAIGAALRNLGFETTIHHDLGLNEMRRALRDFGATAADADIATVFYAGHGLETGGKNYLVPTDARLARSADVDLEAISLDTVLQQIEGVKRLRLVILDACRNNIFPLAGARRALPRGLSRIEPEDNTLVAYAAKDGTTADDGTGDNSPFTTALLRHLPTPNLDIGFVFRRVRDDVSRATGGQQQPHVYGTLGGEAILLQPGTGEASTGAAEPARLEAERRALDERRRQSASASAAIAPSEAQLRRLTQLFDEFQVTPAARRFIEARGESVQRSARVSAYTVRYTDSEDGIWTNTWRVSQLGRGVQLLEGDGDGPNSVRSSFRGLFVSHITLALATTADTSGIASGKRWSNASTTRSGELAIVGSAPSATGDRLRWETRFESTSRSPGEKLQRYQYVVSHDCMTTEKLSASAFHPKIPGNALVLRCDMTSEMKPGGDRATHKVGTVYFEALGFMVGVDPTDGRRIVDPKQRFTLVDITLE